jgi:phenylalanyl-tRNA synthetase alpha chain
MDGVTGLREKHLAAIAAAADEAALEEARLGALGKKGEVSLALRASAPCPPRSAGRPVPR